MSSDGSWMTIQVRTIAIITAALVAVIALVMAAATLVGAPEDSGSPAAAVPWARSAPT